MMKTTKKSLSAKEKAEKLVQLLQRTGHVPCSMCGQGSFRECLPVMIGDVLEKVKTMEKKGPIRVDPLIELWYHCGFTKSLNDIFSGVEFNSNGYVLNLLDLLWGIFKDQIK